jgi:hypothetical protein
MDLSAIQDGGMAIASSTALSIQKNALKSKNSQCSEPLYKQNVDMLGDPFMNNVPMLGTDPFTVSATVKPIIFDTLIAFPC